MHAYFDCFSGISGDMTLGALIHLGAPVDRLRNDLAKLPMEFSLNAATVQRNGIEAVQVKVDIPDEDHHRSFSEIVRIIERSPLDSSVKEVSERIFRRIADAESRIHGCGLDEVHFHEVGAVDAIVDIVGTALCLDYLGIERVVASTIAVGTGLTRCRHGVIPVPAPATVEILKNVPVVGSGVSHELTTPTGAAIIATIADRFEDLPPMKIEAAGYGAGSATLEDRPNLLRVIGGDLIEADSRGGEKFLALDRVVMIESAVDDMNPEILGYLMERLFEDGALDVLWVPVYMKKNRPATLIQVLCRPSDERKIAHRVLSETTVTGVRVLPADRYVLHREVVTAQTPYGAVQAKRIVGPDGKARLVPEFEECRRIAREKQMPIREVYERISRAFADE